MEGHRGYGGGITQMKDTGLDMPYYATPLIEVVFHEAVRMPVVKGDPKQIMKVRFHSNPRYSSTKKRHIGNDNIHIVWSEHPIEYPPSTIISQFNSAHVLIYPLSNGLFKIQIAKKAEVSLDPHFF